MSTKTNKRGSTTRDRPVQDLPASTRAPLPGYFIVRKTGQVVPLVAVDELPPGVDLIGVPRNLDLVETGGMLNLGLQGEAPPGTLGGGGFYRLVGLEAEEESDEYEDEDGVMGSSGYVSVVELRRGSFVVIVWRLCANLSKLDPRQRFPVLFPYPFDPPH